MDLIGQYMLVGSIIGFMVGMGVTIIAEATYMHYPIIYNDEWDSGEYTEIGFNEEDK